MKRTSFLKPTFGVLFWALGGVLVAVVVGYILGAAAGLVMTSYNNNYMSDVPQGSYLWWANFMGHMFAVFAAIPGAMIGLVVKTIQLVSRTSASEINLD